MEGLSAQCCELCQLASFGGAKIESLSLSELWGCKDRVPLAVRLLKGCSYLDVTCRCDGLSVSVCLVLAFVVFLSFLSFFSLFT